MRRIIRTLLAGAILSLCVCPGAPIVGEEDSTKVDEYALDIGETEDNCAVQLRREDRRLRMDFQLSSPFEDGDLRMLQVYIRSHDHGTRQYIWKAVTGTSSVFKTRRVMNLEDSGGKEIEYEPDEFFGAVDAGYQTEWKASLWFDIEGIYEEWGELEFAFSLILPNVVQSYSTESGAFTGPGEGDYKGYDLSLLVDHGDSEARKRALQTQILGEKLIPPTDKLAKQGKFQQARLLLNSGLRLFPRDVSMVFMDVAIEAERLDRAEWDPQASTPEHKKLTDALRQAVNVSPSWLTGHAWLITAMVEAGKSAEAHEYAESVTPDLMLKQRGIPAHAFLRACLIAAAASGEWDTIPALLDFETLVAEPVKVRDWNLKTEWIKTLFEAAEHALAAGELEVARSCFEGVMELWHPDDVYNRLGRLRLRWCELLFEHAYSDAVLQYVEGLDFEVDRSRATDLIDLYVKALGLAADPPDGIEKIGAMLEKPVGQNNNETRKALTEYRDLLLDHLDDWNQEAGFREEDAGKTNPVVTIETDKGTFKLELFEDDAPNTVANFVKLVGDGFYDGLLVYRHEPGWLIQGGGSDNSPTDKGPGWAIQNEANNRQHWRGTIAMARTMEPDSASTHFFITIGNHPTALELDTDWVVFGRITEGLENAQRLREDDRIIRATAGNLRDHEYKPERIPVEDE